MNTIDLSKPLTDINGVEIKDKPLSKVLSEVLAQVTEGKTLKLYDWYKTLLAGKPLSLDDSDKKDLEALIENNKTVFLFVKGQLLEAISSTKE